MMENAMQTSLFDFAYPAFKFTKPVRLIELFAGYGSQMMAMERLQKEGLLPKGLESWGICEWAIPSFIAWAKIHAKDDHVDYSDGMAKEKVARALFYKGVSLDWKTPAPFEALMRKPEDYLRAAYNAMRSSKNQVDITRTHGVDFSMADREGYEVVMTWSFPCQSLSLAGKRAGMDEGSGSESSLGYEVLRLLDEMKEIGQLPTVLVMENVPQFASSSNHENIMKIQDRLGKLGYKSYVQIQSATDFGVPQTRKRCFMISVLGDYSYSFPTGFPLTLKLKDKLEESVDQKYYLSRKMMKYVLAKPTKNFGPGLKEVVNPSIARTVNANYGRYRAGIDTYVSPDCEENADLTLPIGGLPIKDATKKGFDLAHEGDGVYISNLKTKRGTVQLGMIQTLKTKNDVGVVVSIHSEFGKTCQSDNAQTIQADYAKSPLKHGPCAVTTESAGLIEVGNIYPESGNPQAGRIYDKEGLSPALDTMSGGNRQPKIITDNPMAFGLHLVTNGNGKFKKGEDDRKVIAETNGVEASYSLTTMDKMTGLALLVGKESANPNEGESICLNPKGGRGGVEGLQPSLENRVYDSDGCAVALATGFQPKYAIGADGRIDLSAVYMTNEEDPRFLVWDGKEWRELRIRRLTPRECFRLQDVSDSDFDLIKDSFAESTLYHLAGDSICVANLYYDFMMMCDERKGEEKK